MLHTFFYSTWVQGVAYQKPLIGPKLTGVWVRGASQKFGTLFISASIEANNFKFAIRL